MIQKLQAQDYIEYGTFSKKFLLACQDAATWKVESGTWGT